MVGQGRRISLLLSILEKGTCSTQAALKSGQIRSPARLFSLLFSFSISLWLILSQFFSCSSDATWSGRSKLLSGNKFQNSVPPQRIGGAHLDDQLGTASLFPYLFSLSSATGSAVGQIIKNRLDRCAGKKKKSFAFRTYLIDSSVRNRMIQFEFLSNLI